jgi:hypothetical protein
MDSIAMIAARICRRRVSENQKPVAEQDETAGSKPWRRAPRTKAALANKMRAIQKVIEILERSNVPFSQPLPGKFVIEPLPRVTRGKAIVFWPARRRLRIGRHSTETNGIHAFQQALADQGHPIPGYFSRAKPRKPQLFRARNASEHDRRPTWRKWPRRTPSGWRSFGNVWISVGSEPATPDRPALGGCSGRLGRGPSGAVPDWQFLPISSPEGGFRPPGNVNYTERSVPILRETSACGDRKVA